MGEGSGGRGAGGEGNGLVCVRARACLRVWEVVEKFWRWINACLKLLGSLH